MTAFLRLEAVEPPPGLSNAASAAIKKFLPALDSPEMKERHGFAPNDGFSKVTLGDPFQPRYLPEEAIEKYATGAKVTDLLIGGNSWYFPVFSDGKIACFLTLIQQSDGSWMEDKLGMAELARIWAAVCDAWPASKGYTPVFIIVPSRQRFLFTVPQAGFENLTPLPVLPNMADPKRYAQLSDAAKTFAALRNHKPSIQSDQ